MANTKTAVATATSPTTYDVSYPPGRSQDRDVSYDYLRRLARDRGYTVTVQTYPGTATAPHTITPDD